MERAHRLHETILVDDDIDLMNELREFVAAGEKKVICFSHYFDAISHARNNIVHMLITDFNMRGMNGAELAHSIMAIHPTVRIVVMSGRVIERSMLLNDWHFLLKPFGLDELERCIN